MEFMRLRPDNPGNLGGGFRRGERRAVPPGVGRIAYETTSLGKRRMVGLVTGSVRWTP